MSKEQQGRLAKLFAGALPPLGTVARKRIQEKINQSQTPESKQLVAELMNRFIASRFVVRNNGLGYPIDQLLRYYVDEYNHRAATAGLYSMPTSFSFMEAFMEYQRPLCIFLPKSELNSLCSFTDFLDWATSKNQQTNSETLKQSIESNRVYLFSNTANPDSLKFRCRNNVEISVLSAGLIRDRNEIITFLQLAESEPGIELEFKKGHSNDNLRKMHPFAASQKEGLQIASELAHERVQTKGMKGGYESVCMMRFDVEKQAILNRAIYQDWGDSYRASVDDSKVLGGKDYQNSTAEQRRIYDSCVEVCNDYQVAFELCQQFTLLPHFQSSYLASTHHFEQPTQLKQARTGLKASRLIDSAINEQKIYSRKVCRIEVPRDISTGKLVLKISSYDFEDSGYWQTLMPWEIGHDENGLPEQGRTWIKANLPTRSGAVAHELTPSKLLRSPVADKTRATYGYIYVMRSAQHEKDVFKIGLTTRESSVRANELSSSTASVDRFSVMQRWEVSDCHKAELAIHDKLSIYRVNPKREFFRCEYQLIFRTIHDVIDSINSAD
jgi:hypothetical protein